MDDFDSMSKQMTTPANGYPHKLIQLAENLKNKQVQLNKLLHKMANKQMRINTHMGLVRQDVEDVYDMFYDTFRLTGEVNCVTLTNMLKAGKTREHNVPDAPKKLMNSPPYVKVSIDSPIAPGDYLEAEQAAFDADCSTPKSSGSTHRQEPVARKLLAEFSQAENGTEETNESLCQTPPSAQPEIKKPKSPEPEPDVQSPIKLNTPPAVTESPITQKTPEAAAKKYKFSKLHKRAKQAVPILNGDSVEEVPIVGSPVPVKRLRLGTSTPVKPAPADIADGVIAESPLNSQEETPDVSPIVASGGDTEPVIVVSSPELERFAALTEASNKAKKAGRRLNHNFTRNGK